jgi:hypothetical protein
VLLHQPRRRLGQAGGVRGRELLHPRGETHGAAVGRVVHPGVVADAADHDLAGMQPHARGEAEAVRPLDGCGPGPHPLEQMERSGAGSGGVILVGERRAEQRHDAVSGVLVHRASERVDALGQHLDEGAHQDVPDLRIDSPGELDRAREVDEEHGDVLALALASRAGAQQAVAQVLRRVGRRPSGIGSEGRSAGGAEARLPRRFAPAPVTPHGESSQAGRAPSPGFE